MRRGGAGAALAADPAAQRPAVSSFRSVDAGWEHACAIGADGDVACWGNSYYGQAGLSPKPNGSLNDGKKYMSDDVVELPPGLFTALSAGGEHTCGLRTDATLACWGHDYYGQADPPRGRFTAVTAGAWHSCAISVGGTVQCWGFSNIGAPGDERRSSGACFLWTTAAPEYCWRAAGYEPDGVFSSVSAGALHTCGLRPDSTISCWGHGPGGRIDSPDEGRITISSPMPNPDDADGPPDDADGPPDDADGPPDEETPRPLQWGPFPWEVGPLACQLRPETSPFHCSKHGDVGQAAPPPGTYRAVTAGGWHTCALRTDNTLDCWGDDTLGQATPPPGTYTAVAAGWAHTCALRTDGTLDCWGDDIHNQATPPPGTYTDLTAGGIQTCALRTDATITCWGTPGHAANPPNVKWWPTT